MFRRIQMHRYEEADDTSISIPKIFNEISTGNYDDPQDKTQQGS